MQKLQERNSAKQQGSHNHGAQEPVQRENKEAVDIETDSKVPSTVYLLEPATKKDVKDRQEDEDSGETKMFLS